MLMKRTNRLRYGEIFEIIGLDNLMLPSSEFRKKTGLFKEIVEKIEHKQRVGAKISKRILNNQRKQDENSRKTSTFSQI